MKTSEQRQPKLKVKLKYILHDYMNKDEWRRSWFRIQNQPFPIIATLDLKDEETAKIYKFYAMTRGTQSCIITIGYERRRDG